METIDLYNGVTFVIPDTPKKELIFGYELPKKDQKWARQEIPIDIEQYPENEQLSIYATEFKRRKEGFWFYNNGVATYITGHHYFYLNWCEFPFGFPVFRDTDKRAFYFWQTCEDDDECMGETQIKFRRRGSTSQGHAIALNTATLYAESNIGYLSKTGGDAKDDFGDIVDLYLRLPDFMRPKIEGGERPKTEMRFVRPSKKGNSKIRELNSKITWKNTVENAYDGKKLKLGRFDEVGKYETANFEKLWDIHRRCFLVGRKIVGKAYCPSTVNEMGKGGKAFKSVWNDSDFRDKNLNGRTRSGLYRYFIPAYDGLEGFIDEYGESVIDNPAKPVKGIDGAWITIGAKEYCDNEREALKNDRNKLAELKRQMPYVEDEALREEGVDNAFDTEKIYEQLDYNNHHKPILRKGNFVWKNGVRDTEVVFQEDAHGKWLVYWMPSPEKRNAKIMKNGKIAPAHTADGNFGIDPVDSGRTSDGRKSNAASLGFLKPDLVSVFSNCFVTEYIYRPSDPYIFYEDMIMQSVFYSWGALVETNKIGCKNHFELRGYGEYLMNRPAFTHSEWSKEHTKDTKGAPSSGQEFRGKMMELLQSYIYNHIGFKEDGQIGVCPFERTLMDWAKFDPEKWTDYDATVGSMFALAGANTFAPTFKSVQIKPQEMFKRFKNSSSIRND